MPRPKLANGERIIEAFREAYLEIHNQTYNVNYGMLVVAERMSKFYNMNQMNAVIKYFIEDGGESIYDLLYNIDRILMYIETNEEAEKEFESLKKKTTKLTKQIAKRQVGRI